MPLDKNLEKPTLSIAMPIVTTPTQDTIFRADGPREANGHEVGNRRRAAKPPKFAIFGTDKPRDTIGHGIGKPTPKLAKANNAS
jgi:hypothetical protein